MPSHWRADVMTETVYRERDGRGIWYCRECDHATLTHKALCGCGDAGFLTDIDAQAMHFEAGGTVVLDEVDMSDFSADAFAVLERKPITINVLSVIDDLGAGYNIGAALESIWADAKEPSTSALKRAVAMLQREIKRREER